MTATTSTLRSGRGRAAFGHIRGLARVAGSLLSAIGSRWNDFVDAAQLGPGAESVTSRHTGARI